VPTAAFTTLGCKVNQYETQRILDSFAEAGFGVVAFDQPADVYVINTCSVTAIAESKSRYAVRKAARTNPGAKVVVTGCAAQMAINQGEAMEADLVVPNPEKLATREWFFREFPAFEDWVRREPCVVEDAPPGRTRATLKIQDGCSVMCSYCSIPFTRPGMVSRPWWDVLSEAQKLAAQGYQEAILTGVLIGAYGPESGSEGLGFEELVQVLARDSGLPRLRISSIEMHQVTEPILDLARAGHVTPHFHIPLQCGDDQVLRDMNRRYESSAYLALCDHIRTTVADATITTDVMVGFPTETAERFENSASVVQRARYLKAHVFRFSPRPGTPADAWGDPVSPPEKQRRALELSRIAGETAELETARFLGRTLRVLVEGKTTKDGLLEGTTDNWLTVRFAGPATMRRTLQWVRLDEARDGVVYGEMAEAPRPNPIKLRSA
jgi:threonylcarbamoyladenosine tRNA methylthiotransferase MtaB